MSGTRRVDFDTVTQSLHNRADDSGLDVQRSRGFRGIPDGENRVGQRLNNLESDGNDPNNGSSRNP